MTITLTKPKTQIIWRSPDLGDKTTSIPGSVPDNKGYELDIKATLANGDTYIVTPTSGTIGGEAGFTFTLPVDETCNLSLVSDADNADWIVRCLCCVPVFTVGAVAFRGQTFLWNFPAMVDSPEGSISFWIKTEQSQISFPFNYTPDVPDGDVFHLNSGYIIGGPPITNFDAFFIGQGSTHHHLGNNPALRHVNPIIDISSTNFAIITFTHPHGITAGANFLPFSFHQTSWTAFSNKNLTAMSVTATTITTDFDATGFPAYNATSGTMLSPGPNSAGLLQILNAPVLNFTDATALLDFSYDATMPISSGAWVNVLASWQTNHAAGAKIATLYYGDTLIAQDGSFPSGAATNEFDIGGSFAIPFSTPSASVDDSWMVGGNSTGSVLSNNNIICDMAELWFAPGQYIDFTNSANRAKFHNGSNKPVSLGANGSLPTGAAPTLYLSIPRDEIVADNFANNLSGAGALSVAGDSLTIAPTSPTD